MTVLSYVTGCVGVGLILAAPWLLSRAGRRWGSDDLVLKPPRRLFEGHDDRLRVAAERRRQQAAAFRKAGARFDSGALTVPTGRVVPMGGRR